MCEKRTSATPVSYAQQVNMPICVSLSSSSIVFLKYVASLSGQNKKKICAKQ
jgi:hypothetical protein